MIEEMKIPLSWEIVVGRTHAVFGWKMFEVI
jgi:hypothetical protein